MIEINLLPSAKKKKARGATTSGGPKFDFGAAMGSVSARLRDPWLIFAVVGMVIGLAATGVQWVTQSRKEAALTEQLNVAVQDSARYASVLAQRRTAEAQRDSIQKQIAVIASLDGNRFVWPHVLDEISRALPTYTWLNTVAQTNPAATASPEATAAGTAPPVAIRVIGYTVDVQALTIFMTQLEASPFLANVNLVVSELATVEGKQVTEFTLTMQYSKPDPSVIRTVPLTVAVR